MALNLMAIVSQFLQDRPEQKFTARDIAEWIFKTYPEECRQKQERSTATVFPLHDDAALIQQIIAEIGSHRPALQKKQPKIKSTEERPRKFYFTEATDAEEIITAEKFEVTTTTKADDSDKLSEHDLYPKLSKFLMTELGVYSKRIDERRASNKKGAGGNKWLYPDLVGLEDLSHDWHKEIKECAKEYGVTKTKLWSFEVKILINRSNVREVFFQAVSNSSWANFGYLVASEIEGTDTMKELRMLSGLHGIGLIQLDNDSPSDSQIMIPAKERSEVDWNNANRLAEENKDFYDYVKQIRMFYQTGEIANSNWDAVPDET